MKSENLGIIGYGKMGKLLANKFSEKYKIGIYSIEDFETEFEVFESIESLYDFCSYLVITVPNDDIKEVLDTISKTCGKESKVIFDITTFKKEIIDAYKNLPEHLKLGSVHPMFGDGIDTLKDENVIIVPIEGREEEANHVEKFFEQFGANISRLDVEEHDELMKVLIGVPYFLGISYLRLISEFENIERYGGTSFEFLSTYGKSVLNDQPAFIEDVIDHSEDIIDEFLENSEIHRSEINKLKEKYDDEIGESYSKFYDVIKEEQK